MNAIGKKSNRIMIYRELDDKRKEEELEKSEIYYKKIYRSPMKEEYDKIEESNKIVHSDREIDREKDRLEAELREKQDRLKKLIREKNQIERNLEDKYEKELKYKKNLTLTLLSIVTVLIGVFIIQYNYI